MNQIELNATFATFTFEGETYTLLIPSDQDPEEDTKVAYLVCKLEDGTYITRRPPPMYREEPSRFKKIMQAVRDEIKYRIYWSDEPLH